LKDNIILKVEELSKYYEMGEMKVKALEDASFEINEGELVVILGPSGSGKSTLLNIVGGMDTPTHGKVFVKGEEITKYNEKQLTLFRRNEVGFVFQFYNIMGNLTAFENVELAVEICKDPFDVDEILGEVELTERRDHFPSQLSGGEQQRVAIARAVAKNPLLLLCDEPTGALDCKSGVSILVLLKKVNKEYGKTVVLITHNASIAEMADKVIRLSSGHITEVTINNNPIDPERVEW